MTTEKSYAVQCVLKNIQFIFIDPQYCLTEQQCLSFNLEVKSVKAGQLENDHLTAGICINCKKLEPFGEVCSGPPGHIFRWAYFSKITNKQEAHVPRFAHMIKTAIAYLQMPCNFF